MNLPASFSWRRVTALVVIAWLALIWLRACGLVVCPWMVLTLPIFVVWVGVLLFILLCGLACLAIRSWLWLVKRAERRRRERQVREFRAAVESGFAHLVDRPLSRDEEARRL